jgi:branched-chain amino acid transport system substrate-binding protein
MRRRVGWTAGLCALSLALSSCTSITGGGNDDEILIGVTLERSGAAQILGNAEAAALQLIEDRVNEKGVLGRKVKLLIRDNKSDPKLSAQHVNDLIDRDKVVGVLGAGTTPTTLSIIDSVESKKVPTISMGASEQIVTPVAKRQYMFKTPPGGTAALQILLEEFALRGIKRIASITPNDAYGETGVRAAAFAAQRGGVTIVGAERYEESEQDYSVQVGRLVETQPQAILVGGLMPGAGIVAKNIKETGYQGRVYFDGGAGSDLFVSGAGKNAEGMFMITTSIVAANHIPATSPSVLAQKEFFAEYTQRTGTFSGYASYAADAMNLMVEAIRKAGSTDREKIRDTLENLTHDGLSGSYRFTANNHGGASADGMTILVVRNGGWVLAE